MTAVFEKYKARKIRFFELLKVNGWAIKAYTITNRANFHSSEILENVKRALPKWLSEAERTTLDTYKKAFLIVHEGREGVWVLLNCWTGGEMIQTKVFFIEYHKPGTIQDSPYAPNSLLCVWELEVFVHERTSWINNVLRKAESPQFDYYLMDVLNNG